MFLCVYLVKDLLRGMLNVDPESRMTADKTLAAAYFRDVRNTNEEFVGASIEDYLMRYGSEKVEDYKSSFKYIFPLLPYT